ncbi:MAG: DNA polymerase III subunit gamma/tau [Bacteroidia bacterium]|nr:DNA polymerase III subunit gamma/tau [Bacteroidia bacterium]
MNPFVVSARKYRPSTFDTVVGQAHITSTLKNAIRTKHLAQAFLFCGPRGVGKTTCARILAKTMNCKNLSPEIEACNNCESCLSFNSGQSLNIYELDAASNNSVDDIRNLVEQVRYAPHSGEYKIYIIDEVHMLTANAFNAFLKTLEEPPSYAIFILATTEKHKIIPTILSRCQIFDFNRIQIDDIAHHLSFVAGKEGVQAEDEALHVIAQKADGALRDALSIFDQIVSFAGNHLSYKDVINNLSILDYEYYFKVTDEIRTGNIPAVLLTFNELLADGFDGHHFINGLASHFRDLLVSKDESTLPLLEVSKSAREKYKVQASELQQFHLLKYLSICSQCDIDYRSARNQRLHVELALIRLCSVSGGSIHELTPRVDFDKAQAPAAAAPSSSPSPAQKGAPAAKAVSPAIAAPAESPKPPAAVAAPVAPVAHAPAGHAPGMENPVQSPGGGSGLLKGASLSSLRKQAEANTSSAPVKAPSLPDMAEPFDLDKFMDRWNRYAGKVREDGKLQLYTTMTMNAPTLLENFLVELVIHNPAQSELLQEEKSDMLDWLRKELGNYKLNLVTRLEEKANDPEQAYTNKEKYKKMNEKNPGLDDFRQQLGLELEL